MVGEGGNAGLAPSTMTKAHFFQEGAKIYIPVLCGRTQLPPPASQPGPRPPGTALKFEGAVSGGPPGCSLGDRGQWGSPSLHTQSLTHGHVDPQSHGDTNGHTH